MNAYLLTGLAMCLIVLLALAGTAYLAVFFNRRAKADLEAALAPLASAIDGSIDLDEAQVRGRWRGNPVYARMANASEGPGRVFQVDVVDAAGGESWRYTSNPPARGQTVRTVDFTGPETLRDRIEPIVVSGASGFIDPDTERFRIEYLSDGGLVRLVRAMRSRRDIPSAETFLKELDLLTAIAAANRTFVQAGPDAVSMDDGAAE